MTRVAILWHMHQPFYEDLVTGEHVLPWVRLHALKDYWGMVALLDEFPDVHLTFNLVPSLLVQLEAFAQDRARDPYLDIGLKPAEALSDRERAFCLEHFFRAHRPRMIEPYPRYRELLARREDGGVGLTVGDFRDLQMWHKLVWLDPAYLDGDARVRAWLEKGRGFSEEDKQQLRGVEMELLQRVIPAYRAAAALGQVELSTSPFYHPILPLLCDSDVHLVSHPRSRMPRDRFRHPEDAEAQLTRAVAHHERTFGTRPAGLWPSEGSVSNEMVPLVARAGFTWMATDEGILSQTLRQGFTRDANGHVDQAGVLYKPYRVGAAGASVACAFRDHTLSDLIGFSYASWSPEAAAEDFVGRLVEGGRRSAAQTAGEPTIFVILDGENAWEHFEGQGRPFLRALYRRLSDHPELRTVTMVDACSGARDTLQSIHPGSWIHSDFYIWMGHPDDHRAWTQLGDARRAIEAAAATAAPEAVAAAREEVFIAEGSDWFWWYGDDHSSENDPEFDELFRRHLRNAYGALGLPVPDELFVTNISTRPPEEVVMPPMGRITPVLDGEVTSYFEWLGAGLVESPDAAGAMQRAGEQDWDPLTVSFGYGEEALFVRVDAARPMRGVMAQGLTLALNLLQPAGYRVTVGLVAAGTEVRLLERDGQGWRRRDAVGLEGAVGRIAELRIPFGALGLRHGSVVSFTVSLNRGPLSLDAVPRHRAIEMLIVRGEEPVAPRGV